MRLILFSDVEKGNNNHHCVTIEGNTRRALDYAPARRGNSPRQRRYLRSRPYRKNDNCFAEQKNNSVVRRCVGYPRYDSPQALDPLRLLDAQEA
jgi:hypothetical protein